MNVVRSTPSVDAADSVCSPGPRTNRNSSGWISDVTIRMRSSAKRIRSRRQTIAHRPGLRPPGALGHPDGDDVRDRGAHRPAFDNTRIVARLRSRAGAVSASRIVEPV